MSSTPDIPDWEWTQLQQLAAAGDLSGVNPVVIGGIDQAESSGEGGGINSEGYGGFFGLGSDSTYPGGSTSPALLQSTTVQSFDQQAEIAASAFNSYLSEAGGNAVTAEEIYQSGSASGPTEGSKIIAALLGGSSAGGSASGSSTTATEESLNASPLDLFGIPSTAASATWSDVGPFLVKAMLVGTGLGILILAAWKAASPSVHRGLDQASEGPPALLGLGGGGSGVGDLAAAAA